MIEEWSYSLEYIFDQCETQEIRERAVGRERDALENISDNYKTQQITIEAVEKWPYIL